MLETPLERNQVCLGFILDKLYEMDRACKRPGFGSPQGGVKYKPMAPQPSPKAAQRPSLGNNPVGKRVSLNAIRGKGAAKNNNDRSVVSHLSSAYEEEYNSNTQQEGDDDDKDDFACVPVNNIDNETVHIKVLEEDPKRSQVGGHPVDSTEMDNVYH